MNSDVGLRQSLNTASRLSANRDYEGVPGKKGNLEENPAESKYVCLVLGDGEKYEGYMQNGMRNGKGKL